MTRKLLAISVMSVLLAACAAGTGTKGKRGDCRPGEITILNEDTNRYDCVSEAEYEKILDELDEVRW